MVLMACLMFGVSGLSTALVIHLSTDSMMPNAVWTSDYKDIPPQIVPWRYAFLHLRLRISEPTKIKTGYALRNSFFFSFLPSSLIRRCQHPKWVCEHLIPAVYSKWGKRKQEGQKADSSPGDPWKPTPTLSQCGEAHTVSQNKQELLIQSSCSLGQTMLGCLPASD